MESKAWRLVIVIAQSRRDTHSIHLPWHELQLQFQLNIVHSRWKLKLHFGFEFKFKFKWELSLVLKNVLNKRRCQLASDFAWSG